MRSTRANPNGYDQPRRTPWPKEVHAMTDVQNKRGGWSWWYVLFVIQFAVVLWPPFYNKIEPTLMGIPFFYWFQLLWVIVSAVFTAIVYFATSD
jgi:hypothetical protein